MNIYQLKTSQRINRVLVGTVLILATMLTPVSPLGWIAVLPLVATYPIFCGMFGFDPVAGFINHEASRLYHIITHIHGAGHRPHHG